MEGGKNGSPDGYRRTSNLRQPSSLKTPSPRKYSPSKSGSASKSPSTRRGARVMDKAREDAAIERMASKIARSPRLQARTAGSKTFGSQTFALTDKMKDETMEEISKALQDLTDDGKSIHVDTLTKIGNSAAREKAMATKSVADRVVESLKAGSAQTEMLFTIGDVALEIRRRIPHDEHDRLRLIKDLKAGSLRGAAPAEQPTEQPTEQPAAAESESPSSLAKYTREAGGMSLADKVAAEAAEKATKKAVEEKDMVESAEKGKVNDTCQATAAPGTTAPPNPESRWFKGKLLEEGMEMPAAENKVPPTAVKASSSAVTKPQPKEVATLCSQPMMMVAIAAGVCLTAFGVAFNLKKQGKLPKSWPWTH